MSPGSLGRRPSATRREALRLAALASAALCAAPAVARAGGDAAALGGWPADVVRPGDLVAAVRGSVPILLTAPHGGSAVVPGVEPRTEGVIKRDSNTAEIAWLAAQRVTDLLAAKPFVVVAQFHRKYADANRAPEEAYRSPAAGAHYDAYHRAIATFLAEILATHGGGVLLDLHGQVRISGAILRGTRNGKTAARLLAAHGPAALTGPEGLFGRLKAKGYDVVPPNDARPEDEDGLSPETQLDGGFTVARYGAMAPDGLDAIQIEIGDLLRDRLVETARDLGEAIAGWHRSGLAFAKATRARR